MKRKTIKLISLIVIVILVFGIYKCCRNKKINYVALEEGFYTYSDYLNDYLNTNNKLKSYNKYITIDNIIDKINSNSKIKKDLRESDLVTLLINNKNNLSKIEEVRKYAKKELIVIGHNDIGNTCIKYKCEYIKIDEDISPKDAIRDLSFPTTAIAKLDFKDLDFNS